jgi:hypothetical protein
MSGSVPVVNGSVDSVESELGQGEGPPKTAKQLEKEAKKLAKLEKFKQKKDKQKDAPVQTKEKVEVRDFAIGSRSFRCHMVVT